MHNPDLAIVDGEPVQQQPQPQRAGQGQKAPGKDIQLLEVLGTGPRQEVLQRPFDGEAEQQDDHTGDNAG